MSLNKKEKAAALKRLLALRKANDNFIDFVRLLHPDWNIPKFHLDQRWQRRGQLYFPEKQGIGRF